MGLFEWQIKKWKDLTFNRIWKKLTEEINLSAVERQDSLYRKCVAKWWTCWAFTIIATYNVKFYILKLCDCYLRLDIVSLKISEKCTVGRNESLCSSTLADIRLFIWST